MGNSWDTSRAEAFSDGVFAIAITLLVLDIGVPESAFVNLWEGIVDQWPSYLAYVTSFTTIGGVWLVHHGIFRRLAAADRTVMRLNLLVLMLVAFLPFPTRLLAQAIEEPDAERTAVIFYGLVLLAISLVLSALWRHVATNSWLVEADVTDRDMEAIGRVTTPNVGFYLAIVLFALLAPQLAVFAYLIVAIVAVFRQRGDYVVSSSTATTPERAR